MKHKHALIGSIIVFAILIIGGTIYYWPKQQPERLAIKTDTKEIGPTQSIGGQSKNTSSAARPAPTTSDALIQPISPTEPEQPKPRSLAPKQDEITKSVKKEYPYRALLSSNDPLTTTSWALATTNARSSWDNGTGNGTVIAIIDSGFALTHEDLVDQWAENIDEMGMTTTADRCWTGSPTDKKSNSCDDDDNGYVDDWRGWNFVDRTNNPQAGITNPTGDGVAHGTQVAGLAGAKGNNGIGIATMAWNNTLMPLQALDDDGAGYTSSVAAAIYYAVDNGAQVINMSLGGDADDPALRYALDYAYDNNVIVVAAAGNCGTGLEAGCDPTNPGAMGYPALYPHVIAVGASNSTADRASFSSFGPGLDVLAPGSGSLVSTMWTPANPSNSYASSLYGTSFASPIVASYVGLILSLYPNYTVADITALVDSSARKVDGMSGEIYNESYGHGVIDASSGTALASKLSTATSESVVLAQTGSEFSEHTFTGSSSLSSSCQVDGETYCTIWAYDNRGFDRYLPYMLSSTNGTSSWQWSGSTLGPGDWTIRARSGVEVSPSSYSLSMK